MKTDRILSNGKYNSGLRVFGVVVKTDVRSFAGTKVEIGVRQLRVFRLRSSDVSAGCLYHYD